MLISIIIPTRDRAQYLRHALATATAIEDPDVEIIVSDNASVDNPGEVAAAANDNRVRYVNTGARVSMRQNFEFALNESRGDYVIFFGDDDGILPGQFRFLRQILHTSQPDAVSWRKATYGWPIEGFGKKTGGIRFYRSLCFGELEFYDPRDSLADLMNCELSALDPAPNIYHGCVSRSYLDRHKPAKDAYFDGTIPDVNFQFRCTYVGGKFINVRHPFTINGYSPASTGGAHSGAKGDAERVGKAFTADNEADPYADILPHYLTIPMVFFSTLETLRVRGGFDQPVPDYARWYRYALTARKQSPGAADDIEAALAEYAARTGTEAEYQEALAQPDRPKRSLRERIERLGLQARSFRLSAAIDGQNTVFSAAQVMDAVLGDDLGDVMNGQKDRSSAWAQARRRAKRFQREL